MTVDSENVRKDNDGTVFVLANHCSKWSKYLYG